MKKIYKILDWDNQKQFKQVFTQDMVDKAINKLSYPRLAPIIINKFPHFDSWIDIKNISHEILYMWTDEYSWYAEIRILDNLFSGKLLLDLMNYQVEIRFSPVGTIDCENNIYNFITVVPIYNTINR
ncbi:MAG: hypothetical protein WC679_02205 [Bacteroidales bacterium]